VAQDGQSKAIAVDPAKSLLFVAPAQMPKGIRNCAKLVRLVQLIWCWRLRKGFPQLPHPMAGQDSPAACAFSALPNRLE